VVILLTGRFIAGKGRRYPLTVGVGGTRSQSGVFVEEKISTDVGDRTPITYSSIPYGSH